MNDCPIGQQLVHPDGSTVTLLDKGTEQAGPFLKVEHRMTKAKAVNGPHWHPVLKETFTVKEGHMRFLVDGRESILSAGEQLTIWPEQVHQFWNISDSGLVAIHKISPPGKHWEMFQLIHKLECEGKMNKKGIPTNPLWVGLAWEHMDGFLAGPPKMLQKVFLGGLASMAKRFGYRI